MRNIQIAWLAGLLEGEGCFRFTTAHSPKIQLQMTDEDVVRKVANLLAVRAVLQSPRKPNHLLKSTKPMWRLDIYGEKALWIMRLVLPFMGMRRTSTIKAIKAIIQARKERRSEVRKKYGVRALRTHREHLGFS